MGNWFETCAISRLPIKTGDKVMVFPIEKKAHIYEEWRACGGSDNWYRPFALPFEALCESEEHFVVEDEEEKTAYIERLQMGKEDQIEVMFVLQNMYEIVLSEMKTRHDVYDRVKTMTQLVKADELEEKLFYVPQTRFDDFFYTKGRPLRLLLEEYAKTKDRVLEEKLIDLFLFHHGLEIMRIPWHPGIGRGSQASEFFLWKKIAEEVIQREKYGREQWLAHSYLEDGQTEDDITKTYLWYI